MPTPGLDAEAPGTATPGGESPAALAAGRPPPPAPSGPAGPTRTHRHRQPRWPDRAGTRVGGRRLPRRLDLRREPGDLGLELVDPLLQGPDGILGGLRAGIGGHEPASGTAELDVELPGATLEPREVLLRLAALLPLAR